MASTFTTKVLILIPFRNEGKFLAKTLNQLQNQKFQDWIVLGQDNNSQDDSIRVFQKFQETDDRFKLFRITKEIPVEKNWNSLYEKATLIVDAEFVCWLGGDDYWSTEDYLSNIIFEFIKAPGTNVVVPRFVASDPYDFSISEPYRVNLTEQTRRRNVSNLVENWANALAVYGVYRSELFSKLAAGKQSRISSYEGSDWWWTFNALLDNKIAESYNSIYVKTFKGGGKKEGSARVLKHTRAGLQVTNAFNTIYTIYAGLKFLTSRAKLWKSKR